LSDHKKLAGPDFAQGIDATDVPVGNITAGRVGDEPALLVRTDGGFHIIGAFCTHYHGPLAEGLVVDDTIRCPWHHACFSIKTGEALRPPAFSPIASWVVEQYEGKIFAREKRQRPIKAPKAALTEAPENVVIIGGGAAGFAAAETLRREQYEGSLVILSNDTSPPVDRPNLSKDFLAGKAPENWIPLKPASFYSKNRIDLRLGTNVAQIDVESRKVVLSDSSTVPYDRLLLATGAEPVRLAIPGANQPNVHTLRSFADSKAIIDAASKAQRAVVLGASFIGLEVAAALRERGIEVHVVAPSKRPLEHIFGPQMGDFIRTLHEEHGVVFHLENTASALDGNIVKISSGDTLEADLVVVGIGVRPRSELAEKAGLAVDRGVIVDPYLETSIRGIFGAGDIARWPDPHSGNSIRIEHWVVAERQGRTAALNMLGRREKFTAVPFFWSRHYDVPINYVGHAEKWDELVVDGDIAKKDCLLRFKQNGQVMAVASIFRDLENLQAEVTMENSRPNISYLARL
jgi:NADPH-dependent 2,4-dienoyl-CoA reductase/sulfur reductase-like enzyme/nitrite reductase/ring-hydroxylating ferredoxin subunit